MKAFLIDPFNHTITEVEYSGDYREISTLLQCSLFTTVTLNEEGDTLFVDDEGLYVDNQRFFTVEGYPQPLGGRGLVLGSDCEGESVAPQKVTAADLRGLIGWVRPDLELQEMKVEEGEVEHPVFGKAFQISTVPIFGTRKKGE